MSKWFLFLAALFLFADNLSAQAYTARACGFDMNDNGTIGEAADCNVCDGVTTDVDGDTVDEDLIYVDATSGDDSTGDGSAGSPYQTIGFAESQLDGAGDGAEDIICIKGTFSLNSTVTHNVNGVVGSYTRDSWDFPTDPAMIVGWDADNDGSYPPFDTDDTAIVDGLAGAQMLFQNSGDYKEFAHFEVKDNSIAGTPRGFIDIASGCDGKYIAIHDIDGTNINKGAGLSSTSHVFGLFVGSCQPEYVSVINTNWTDCCGGFWARGGTGSTPGAAKQYRFEDNTVSIFGHSSGLGVFKVWGDGNQGYEVIDNTFDGNPAAWSAADSVVFSGITPAQCTQDFTIRGNTLTDLKGAIFLQPSASGFCAVRNLDEIFIEDNQLHLTYEPFTAHDSWGVSFSGGGTNNHNEDVTIRNNFFSYPNGIGACLKLWANDDFADAQWTIVGNTCNGPLDVNDRAAIDMNVATIQENIVFQNNIVSGAGSNDDNIWLGGAPSTFNSDGNVWDPDAAYYWNDTLQANFAAWQSSSGADANSTECAPTYVAAATGNLHLDAGDTCAADNGVVNANLTDDIDGDARAAVHDSGADDIGGGEAPPAAPTNLRFQ